ncbi:sigma-w pathway protein ysdB [Neobacillus drentensis]|uniref:sigma-w pathway protein ysdB n=1 Tax=Neobacillus drentensis TaxID=220684 RepID=UPI003000542D
MIWLLRFVLLLLILFLINYSIKALFTPKRKLEKARKQKQFLFIDDEDVRKNFVLTYKGAVFAGEKYLGPADNTFDVVSIFIWPENASFLKGLVKEDFLYIDKKILKYYPHAEIHWKSPVKEFLKQ